MAFISDVVSQPKYLRWWQWGKILGLLAPLTLLALGNFHPLLWALSAHLLVDFTLQSSKTADGKAGGNLRILSYHAFISGGFAGLIVGGLPGLALSALVHFLVDSTRKFGLAEPVGPLLDQLAHVLTLVIIWSLL